MHKRRARARHLRSESTNRTGEKAWLQLSCKEYPPLTAENNKKNFSATLGLLVNPPEKMFQAQAIETRLGLFAPASPHRGELLINRGSGFPF